MSPDREDSLASLTFNKPVIKGVATTVGSREVFFRDSAAEFGLSDREANRLSKALGLDRRWIVGGDKTTADLCAQSSRKIISELEVDPKSIGALIMVTQTPDYASPSTAISLQNKLGLSVGCMAFDMRLGCSGFIYGLSVAYSLVESGLKRVLLCVGDVASRMVGSNDHALAPIMGDAGAAVLIEASESKSYFQLYSDGSGEKALYIPNSGLRVSPDDVGLPALMRMDGAQVFNFTLNRIPALIDGILDFSGFCSERIDYFVLHQPNKYILSNIQRRLSVPDEKFPKETQSSFGNQNSASIPGTISGFLSDIYSGRSVRSLFAGFGIGLSWGACVLETNKIYAPSVIFEEA